jgi:hypothetical protein
MWPIELPVPSRLRAFLLCLVAMSGDLRMNGFFCPLISLFIRL